MTERILSKLVPDPEDDRDFIFEPDYNVILPETVNLREHIGRRLDQSVIGSCTAQTMVNGGEMFLPSVRLAPRFNYYTSRALLGPQFLTGDQGSTARSALKAMNKFGIAREEFCPYSIDDMNVAPAELAYQDAENYKIGAYRRIKLNGFDDIIWQVKYALAKGWPVAVGLQVGEKLRDLKPGELYGFTHPTLNKYWGNHEMLIFGYGTTADGLPYWDIENSWGSKWCDDGCFKALATILGVDVIDLWVIEGFAGMDRVGLDRTIPKPPAPVPEPIPEPTPQPGPAPDPIPEPQPIPAPKKSSNGIVIAIVVAALIAILATQL